MAAISLGTGVGVSSNVGVVGAAAAAPFPAPAGLHWEFVTQNGTSVLNARGPVLILRSN